VFAGPTGSGKSTIIDAICFALYGSVPRYGHRGIVAPVITQGQLEAKVRLDFSVDGARYTAVRIVRRSRSGATTKEARLERGGEVIAGTADELTEAVTAIVGLSFEHFTKCVVLPQGEFARFLHDKPADRQDMLVRLLNLGVYEVMRQMAHGEAVRARSERDVVAQRLENDFVDFTTEALEEAKARVRKLEGLRKRVDEVMPRLEALTGEAATAEASAEAAEDAARLIAPELGWSEAEIARQVSSYRTAVAAEQGDVAPKHAAEIDERVGGCAAASETGDIYALSLLQYRARPCNFFAAVDRFGRRQIGHRRPQRFGEDRLRPAPDKRIGPCREGRLAGAQPVLERLAQRRPVAEAQSPRQSHEGRRCHL
jgi:exonuclease SbcC